VTKLTRLGNTSDFGSVYARNHLAPISWTLALPMESAPHEAVQEGEEARRAAIRSQYRILKLERMVDWYAEWVHEAGLQRRVYRPKRISLGLARLFYKLLCLRVFACVFVYIYIYIYISLYIYMYICIYIYI